MAQPLPQAALDTALHPSEIINQTFAVERRGFSQPQVKSYLEAVAASLRDAQRREAEMRARVGKAVRRAERAETELKAQHQLQSETQVDRKVGDEVTMVLQAAQTAATQRLEEAAEERASIIDEAEGQASQLRDAAGKVLAKRTAEAEIEADKIISAAQSKAKSLVQAATLEGQKIRKEAMSRLMRAREEADLLVGEADEARCQILEDMERKRHRARSQVERLKAGRDRLIENYEVVGRTLDEVTKEFRTSMKEAKISGDSAGRMAAQRPLASRDRLIAEMQQSGRIRRDVRTPVQDSPALPTRSKVTAKGKGPSEDKSEDKTSRVTKQKRNPKAKATKSTTKPVAKAAPKLAPKPAAKSAQKPAAKPASKSAPKTAAKTKATKTAAKSPRKPAAKSAPKSSGKPAAKPVRNMKPPQAPTLKPSDSESAASVAAQPRPHEVSANSNDTSNDTNTIDTNTDTNVIELNATVRDETVVTLDAGSEIDTSAAGSDVKVETLDADIAALHDDQLSVIDLGSDIETVSALGDTKVEKVAAVGESRTAVAALPDAAVGVIAKAMTLKPAVSAESEISIFAQLRATVTETPADVMVGAQTDSEVTVSATTEADTGVEKELDTKALIELVQPKIDELITSNSVEIERKMRRVLAKEQNIALASVRKKNSEMSLVDSLGCPDVQIAQYLNAITSELSDTFAEGYRRAFAHQIGSKDGHVPADIHIPLAEIPAAAIEELIETELVDNIREQLNQFDMRLKQGDGETSKSADSREILREVRDFYREVRSDVITKTARRLVRLSATAGVCSL